MKCEDVPAGTLGREGSSCLHILHCVLWRERGRERGREGEREKDRKQRERESECVCDSNWFVGVYIQCHVHVLCKFAKTCRCWQNSI